MGIMYDKLKPHFCHNIVTAFYGDPENPDNISIECTDCNEVLISVDKDEEENIESSELKPCPFCGSVPMIKRDSFHAIPGTFTVYHTSDCPKCHVYFGDNSVFNVNETGQPTVHHDGYKEVVKKWNRRFEG